MKQQNKIPGKIPNEMEIRNLLDKESKAMVIKMLTELKRRTEEQSKNFRKKNFKKMRIV